MDLCVLRLDLHFFRSFCKKTGVEDQVVLMKIAKFVAQRHVYVIYRVVKKHRRVQIQCYTFFYEIVTKMISQI